MSPAIISGDQAGFMTELQSLAPLGGMLVVKLDHGRHLDNELGATGRMALQQAMAERLAELLPRDGILALQPPDTFLCGLTRSDATALTALTRSIVDGFHPPLTVGGTTLWLTVSVGAASGQSPASAMTDGWDAMRAAAARGGDCCEVVSRDPSALAFEIPAALARSEFSLLFQPQWPLGGGTVVGAEALLRWHGHDLGEIAPNVFLPLAARAGHLLPLADWAVAHALERVGALSPAARPPRLAVNVDAAQLNRPDFTDWLWAGLVDAGFDAPEVELEIPYRQWPALTDTALTGLVRLAGLGVGLAMDGLRGDARGFRIPHRELVTTYKIDRSLIECLRGNPVLSSWLRTLVTTARAEGRRVVAVGVETVEERDLLEALGISHAQGFLFDPPLELDELSIVMERRRNTH